MASGGDFVGACEVRNPLLGAEGVSACDVELGEGDGLSERAEAIRKEVDSKLFSDAPDGSIIHPIAWRDLPHLTEHELCTYLVARTFFRMIDLCHTVCSWEGQDFEGRDALLERVFTRAEKQGIDHEKVLRTCSLLHQELEPFREILSKPREDLPFSRMYKYEVFCTSRTWERSYCGVDKNIIYFSVIKDIVDFREWYDTNCLFITDLHKRVRPLSEEIEPFETILRQEQAKERTLLFKMQKGLSYLFRGDSTS